MPKSDPNLNLLDLLLVNNAIQLNVKAKDWKDAVSKSITPLIKSNAVQPKYEQAVIDSTIKFGPYYIITDQVAMPHARPEDGVNKNAFSLVILSKPVFFDKDPRAISILITFAAVSSEIHVSIALPQVVASFESEIVIKKLLSAKSKEEVVSIFKKVDYSKYLR